MEAPQASRAPAALMWHVTVTVAGDRQQPDEVRAAVERLSLERPFLLTGRYASDRAEIQYWEEARDIDDAAALALRLWGEHRLTADLPPWHVVGLEVVDRETFQRRGGGPPGVGPLVPAGRLEPF
ncbi:MAG: hypothetical protein ACRDYU_06475 [Actinomycetes bacterium]